MQQRIIQTIVFENQRGDIERLSPCNDIEAYYILKSLWRQNIEPAINGLTPHLFHIISYPVISRLQYPEFFDTILPPVNIISSPNNESPIAFIEGSTIETQSSIQRQLRKILMRMKQSLIETRQWREM